MSWVSAIVQGIVANALYALLAAAVGFVGGLSGLWFLFRRLRMKYQVRPLAIAYPFSVTMVYLGNPLDPVNSRIEVHCFVALYAVKRAVESPTALDIAVPESPYEPICRLELGRAPSVVEAHSWGPGLTYSKAIKFTERHPLLQAVARTHGGQLPEMGPVFVEVRVTLPTGHALAEHDKSRVQIGLQYSDPARFIVKIANWPNGVPEPWRQPTFMDFVR